MDIKIKRFDSTIRLPRYEKNAAGLDFYCRTGVTILPKQIVAIPSNVAMKIPKGYFLLIVPRSSTPKRKGLTMPNSVGVIDPYYCGDEDEIQLIFQNITDKPVHLKKGEKIAQGILIKSITASLIEVDKLGKSLRKKYGYST